MAPQAAAAVSTLHASNMHTSGAQPAGAASVAGLQVYKLSCESWGTWQLGSHGWNVDGVDPAVASIPSTACSSISSRTAGAVA